jgi:hypothetical protein
MLILTYKLLNLGYSVGRCGADVPTCVLVILNESPTSPELRCHSNTLVQLMLSSLNSYLIIARVSIALFPRFAQNLTLFLCLIYREIASGQKDNLK